MKRTKMRRDTREEDHRDGLFSICEHTVMNHDAPPSASPPQPQPRILAYLKLVLLPLLIQGGGDGRGEETRCASESSRRESGVDERTGEPIKEKEERAVPRWWRLVGEFEIFPVSISHKPARLPESPR
jgi:hypothetical protein